MTLNAVISAKYSELATQYGNGVAEGYAGYTVQGDNILFTESNNGEGFTVTLADLQLSPEQLAELQNAQNTNGTTAANGATSTSGKSSAEIQAEIDALNEQREDKLEIMEQIEDQINELADSAKEKIAAAAAAREAKAEAYEENVKRAVKESVNEYVQANKSGKGMTQEELQANVKGAVAEFAPDLSDVVANLFVANSEIAIIESLGASLKSMAGEVSQLETDIKVKTDECNAAKAAEAAAAARRCDPIGFTDKAGNRFDFVVMDEDGFNTTSDFLGAQDFWKEMKDLDKDEEGTEGYGKVSIDELREAGIGLTMNGSKDIMDADAIAAMFGEDFEIDLTSYNDTDPTHSAISEVDSDGNNILDQNLIGTFKINSNQGQLDGYNTLDDQEWLAEEYGLEADVENKGTVLNSTGLTETTRMVDGEEVQMSEELAEHYEFLEGFDQTVKDLRTSLQTEWDALGLVKDKQELMNEFVGEDAQAQAAAFINEIEEAQKAKKAEEGDGDETAPADSADNSGADGEDVEIKKAK